MTVRSAAWYGLMVVGSILAIGVSLNGLYEGLVIDKQRDPVLIWTYCLSAILCFPIFILVRKPAVLLAFLAIGFLGTYSALNWRTCAELGYCTNVASTVLQTLTTRWVLSFFSVAAISFCAAAVDSRRFTRRAKESQG